MWFQKTSSTDIVQEPKITRSVSTISDEDILHTMRYHAPPVGHYLYFLAMLRATIEGFMVGLCNKEIILALTCYLSNGNRSKEPRNNAPNPVSFPFILVQITISYPGFSVTTFFPLQHLQSVKLISNST